VVSYAKEFITFIGLIYGKLDFFSALYLKTLT